MFRLPLSAFPRFLESISYKKFKALQYLSLQNLNVTFYRIFHEIKWNTSLVLVFWLVVTPNLIICFFVISVIITILDTAQYVISLSPLLPPLVLQILGWAHSCCWLESSGGQSSGCLPPTESQHFHNTVSGICNGGR